MSRKAMKKTLKRLRSEALEKTKECNKAIEEYNKAIKKDDYRLYVTTRRALQALFTYVKSLEDAYSEFAEPFDKKLEKMEKAVETMDKPTQKKDKTKNQIYT